MRRKDREITNFDEMMKIINSTDEIVRDDAELEVIHCNMILDKILSDNENLALRKRLESEDETLHNGEGGGDGNGNVKCIEIKGEVAKDLFDKLASLVEEGKDGE